MRGVCSCLKLFPLSVAVGEDRCANRVLLHPLSASGGKIIIGAGALCGIFPPLRCCRAPGSFPRQTNRSGRRPYDMFENFSHDGRGSELQHEILGINGLRHESNFRCVEADAKRIAAALSSAASATAATKLSKPSHTPFRRCPYPGRLPCRNGGRARRRP